MADILYINNNKIELGFSSVPRTLQINNFGEVGNIQSNFSGNIKIPKTPKNVLNMEMLGVAGGTSNIPYSEISAKYISNGIEMVSSGKGVIIDSLPGFYSFVFYDGNINMASLLGSETLADLDFSSYNHKINPTNILGSITNTDGYIYDFTPFIEDATPWRTNISENLAVVLFYIHTLFEIIFTQKGFTVSGDVLNDAEFLDRVMTMNKGQSQELKEDRVNVYSNLVSGIVNVTQPSSAYSAVVGSYIVADSIEHEVYFDGIIDSFSGISSAQLVVYNELAIVDTINVSDGVSITGTSNFTPIFGANITILFECVLAADGGDFSGSWDNDYTIKIDTVSDEYYQMNFEEVIGSMKQIDFVKDVMQRFNMSFKTSMDSLDFEFIDSQRLLNGDGGVEDWSDKNPEEKRTRYVSKYASENVAKYMYDNTDDDFADGYFYLQDVNLSKTKTILTSTMKASVLITEPEPTVSHPYYEMFLWKENTPNIFTPNNDGNRIFKISRPYTTTRVLIFMTTNTTLLSDTSETDVPIMTFEGLSYQDEINNNYPLFVNLLQKYEIKTISINLSLLDVYNIDFFKIKTIKQLGGRFYLNKISNFKEGQKTNIEIIKIPV